jgi:hypothetical protein
MLWAISGRRRLQLGWRAVLAVHHHDTEGLAVG